MCGITGWVAFDTDLTRHQDVLTAMTETMVARGPDAGDIWVRPRAGSLMKSADVREGMQAFAERRAPQWTGE
ncbi:hypothetical protein ACFQ68_03100 [Amycolatopsis japonica]|uniref:hypothetical protein n=1 Tax=Amycolatopsis japonica TaxID=208439 RepID=UPI00366A7BE2